jgi:TctA family transporter
MIEALTTAFVQLMSWTNLSYMGIGIFVGLIIGVLPGLGGIAGMSLLIPFVHGLDPVAALAMLIGMVAVVPTGDTFTSVLVGVPGATGSQATVLDGFPLAKRGQAARALSAAFWSSLVGGVFGALVLTFFVVVAKPVILLFSSAELFMLAILGLSVVGVLAGRSVARGVAACGLGIVVGAIGASPATGEFRMDLGITYLQDTIPLVVVGLGAFAIPEISDLMRRGAPVASTDRLGSGWLQGIADTFRHWGLVLRCSIIGTIVGAIPGLGGGVVDWIAYGHAVQTAKDKSQFGNGDVRGILSAESSNNSLQGGALIPTLLFGIPGSGSMAIFLGGMVLLGIEPGPSMVTTQLHLTYTIAWTLMLASIIGAVLCFLLSAPIARLTFVPFNLIAPALIAMLCFAAFQNRQSFADIAALFIMGLLGVLLRRFGWPRPAFLIGFILSEQVENYFYQSLQFNGWNFLTRPGVIIIAILAVFSLLAALRGRVSELGAVAVGNSGSEGETESRSALPVTYDRRPQAAFTALVVCVLGYAIYSCRDLSFLAGVYPMSMAIVTLLFALYLLQRQVAGPLGNATHQDQEQEGEYANDPSVAGVWPQVGWFALLFALTGLFGFIIAITLFIPVFLLARTSLGVPRSVFYTAMVVGFMVGMGYALVLDFPPGLLQKVVELPWPLR